MCHVPRSPVFVACSADSCRLFTSVFLPLHVPARHKHGASFADLLPGHPITSALYHKLLIVIACRHFPCPQKAFYFSNLKTRLVFQLGRHVELQRLRSLWTLSVNCRALCRSCVSEQSKLQRGVRNGLETYTYRNFGPSVTFIS